VASCPMIFMGLALVHFQKYWLLRALKMLSKPKMTSPILLRHVEYVNRDNFLPEKWRKEIIKIFTSVICILEQVLNSIDHFCAVHFVKIWQPNYFLHPS
jgi:hypothetical protein